MAEGAQGDAHARARHQVVREGHGRHEQRVPRVPGWSRLRAMEWAALEAAGSSTRGSGWALSGPTSPWECRAAQSRQARPEEAQEPSWGNASGVVVVVVGVGGGGHFDHAGVQRRRDNVDLQRLRRKQRGTGVGQLLRLLSAPVRAPGCHDRRPASASQSRLVRAGRPWPYRPCFRQPAARSAAGRFYARRGQRCTCAPGAWLAAL